MAHRFPNQGFQPIQNMSNRGMPGMNNQGMYNRPVSNQGMPQGNFQMSSARPPGGGMMQNSGSFQMQQGMQFDGNPQGQIGSVRMQHGPPPQNSVQQGPIVQHVMIPVPVPVGADIPPHLLRPQIITSTGPSVPSQSNFTGSQNHGQYPEMQGQGQMNNMQGQVQRTGIQGQGQSTGMQGHSQMSGLYGQGQMSGMHGQGQMSGMHDQGQRSGMHSQAQMTGMHGQGQRSGMHDQGQMSSMHDQGQRSGMHGQGQMSGMHGQGQMSGIQGQRTGMQGQGYMTGMQSQGQIDGMQGHGHMAGMQGQGQMPGNQSHFQGQGQTPSMQGQKSFQGFQSQCQFQNPGQRSQTLNKSAPVRGSGVDDLNYYMGNESRNRDRLGESTHRLSDHSMKQQQHRLAPVEVYADRAAKAEEFRHRDKRIAQEYEDGRTRSERAKSQSSSMHSYISENVERSGHDFHRKTSDPSNNKWEQVDRYKRHEDQAVKHQEIRNTGQFERHERSYEFDNHGRFEREHKIGEKGDHERQGHYERYSRIEGFERNQRSNRQTEFDETDNYKRQSDVQRFTEHEKYADEERYIRHDYKDSRYEFENVRNVQHSDTNDYRGEQRIQSERRSEAVLYRDGKKEDMERLNAPDYRDKLRVEPERHSEVLLITDGKRNDLERDDTREYKDNQRNEFKRISDTVFYTDGRREDLERRGIEQFEREKRKLSPVSSERSGRKLKRDYSPVSESKSHGELKIHISDRGRWIETDHDLSPVSDGVYEVDRFEEERNRHDRNVYIPKEKGFEQNSLDGAEMISDSESCIEEINNVDLRIHAQNLSPVSQQSSRNESQRFDDRTGSGRVQELERTSPSHSNHSRHSEDKRCYSNVSKYSDDRRSRSHRSQHSEDRHRERRHIPGNIESCGGASDQKNYHSDRRSADFQLNVPDLCPAHNQKGCHWDRCPSLHICKFYIIDSCKFGEYCTKGHDIFKGHSFDTLSKINPGFGNSNVTAEQVKLILKKRLLKEPLPKELERRLTTYRLAHHEIEKSPRGNQQKLEHDELNEKKISPIREPENIIAADPSFDARNYAPGNFVKLFDEKDETSKSQSKTKSDKKDREETKPKTETKSSDTKQKCTVNEKVSERKRTYSSQSKKNIHEKTDKGENKNDRYDKKDSNNRRKRKGNSKENNEKRLKQDQVKNENMLSPISGDEDDWEKYEKYEQISDDGMSVKDEKEDGLDNVSSDDASIEQVQVNRSVDSFPVPTPENIAVPIGMNDPLVFNRPLKNNPQSYIGPLNRPPPMFPIKPDTNAPLFPVVLQNQPLAPTNTNAVVPGFTGAPGTVQGQLPNHLPSPDFMKQVIQNLPSFKVDPIEQKNIFKNDNNPPVIENNSTKKKLKLDKVERDPELKETIKKLWKFPHKGVVNMSIIEFVTETEAYKEEFIAEIVKVLVTLDLPYVTMKKLLSVIKDKVSINVKSETDMRKILEMYPNNFRIIEMVDSDDENDEIDTKKNVQIKANIGIGFCEKHGFLPFAIGKCDCNALHLCKFYFLSDCPNKLCKFGHKLKTDHNVAVLKQHKLHRLTGEEIFNFLADVDNRNKETIPSICKYYVREKGCYKGDNTDYDTTCHSLHLCSYILKGKCMNRDCDRSHSIRDKQSLSLLQKYGLDPDELGDEKVLQILGEKCIENEKGKKYGLSKQSQQTKSSTKSGAVSRSNETNRSGINSATEGLAIVSRSETRVSSKYFVQNFKAPAVCKFYQNAMGCRKKDWGPDGKCFFLHICQHYVSGDCSFGDKCKRSHDLFSGQAAEILHKYNFDLDNLTASDILKRLNSSSGAVVEIPKLKDSSYLDNEKVEITIDCVGEPDDIDMSCFEIPKHSMEVETRVNIEENDGFSSETEGKQNKSKGSDDTTKTKTATKFPSSYESCNIEDVIKHIMEHNKVEKK